MEKHAELVANLGKSELKSLPIQAGRLHSSGPVPGKEALEQLESKILGTRSAIEETQEKITRKSLALASGFRIVVRDFRNDKNRSHHLYR